MSDTWQVDSDAQQPTSQDEILVPTAYTGITVRRLGMCLTRTGRGPRGSLVW